MRGGFAKGAGEQPTPSAIYRRHDHAIRLTVKLLCRTRLANRGHDVGTLALFRRSDCCFRGLIRSDASPFSVRTVRVRGSRRLIAAMAARHVDLPSGVCS